MASKRPNFLFIITDQQRADHLSCYGNDILETPHIDSIASRGLAFDRFYVSCPICMPNRATLMTGRLPSAAGVVTNGQPLPIDSVTFVDVLQAAGYRTALLGKSHLQNMVPHKVSRDEIYPVRGSGDAPPAALSDPTRTPIVGEEYEVERSDLWVKDPGRQINTPYYGFETVRFANLHGDRVQGHYSGWLAERHPDSASLRGPENAVPDERYTAPQAWRTSMSEELYPTTYVEEMTVDYLEDYAKTDREAPFFIQCSFPDPHHPFTPPGKYWEKYGPGDVKTPESLAADHVDPPPFMQKIKSEFAAGTLPREHVWAYACDENEARQSIALTYGMIAMIDDAIGRILAKVGDLGLAEDTVVIFTSDHGDFMGDHAMMLKHCFHHEGLLRVPFIWSDPQNNGAAERTDLLSGTIDIASSVLARAGLAPYRGIQGHDVIAAACNGETLPRLGMVVEEDELPDNARCKNYTRTRTFVTGRWRVTMWLDQATGETFGELYDRDEDPLEVRNLWNDDSAKNDKAELIEMMAHERLRLENQGPTPTFCA